MQLSLIFFSILAIYKKKKKNDVLTNAENFQKKVFSSFSEIQLVHLPLFISEAKQNFWVYFFLFQRFHRIVSTMLCIFEKDNL